MVFVKRGRLSIWIDRRFSDSAPLDRIARVDELFQHPDCEIIKDQRKIKVGRLPLHLGTESRIVYVKLYNPFSWRYRLISLVSDSGAVRSLRGAAVLSQIKISTPRQVAAVEMRRWGMLSESYLITEEITGGKTVDAYWQEELLPLGGRDGYRRRRDFIKDLATLFRSLHEAQIYHNDLKDANIMFVPGDGGGPGRFFLLDLERVRCCRRLSERRRMKNLVQLNRTIGKFVRQSARLGFLKFYLGSLFKGRRLKRHWIESVLRHSRNLDKYKGELTSVF
jgi:serine/threonine protein kinase